MLDKIGWYEVQDTTGQWHKVDAFQAAALKLDGVPIRYQTQAMIVRQKVAEALQNG